MAVVACSVAPSALAQHAVAEGMLKAAFVFNFAKFVDWPGGALQPETLRLCVVGGEDAYRQALADLEGKSAQGREVRVLFPMRLDEAATCHLMVLGDTDPHRWASWIDAVARRPVLTVAEGETFPATGGMIGLVLIDHRVRFDVNTEAARRVGLRVSARLLKLARVVYP